MKKWAMVLPVCSERRHGSEGKFSLRGEIVSPQRDAEVLV